MLFALGITFDETTMSPLAEPRIKSPPIVLIVSPTIVKLAIAAVVAVALPTAKLANPLLLIDPNVPPVSVV